MLYENNRLKIIFQDILCKKDNGSFEIHAFRY